jgi:hypothetical protein
VVKVEGSFQKTSWGWQVSHFQQQVGEWLELQYTRLESVLPKWSWPGGLIDAPGIVWLLKVVFWLLLGLFLVWLGWQLWQLLEPLLYSLLSRTRNSSGSVTTRLSELTAQGWLQRSQACSKQGNYREACRCLYLAMLQHLNDVGIALHSSSRTDGEYLQLVQQLPQLQPYQTLITTHEQLCFGNAEILPETFDQCRQAYQEISG